MELSDKIRQVVLENISTDLSLWEPLEELRRKEPEKYYEFIRYCSMVVGSPMWSLLKTELIKPLKDAAVMNAANYEEVTFYRATINGICLLEDFCLYRKKENDSLNQEVVKEDLGKGKVI